jgi:hypothetical protein
MVFTVMLKLLVETVAPLASVTDTVTVPEPETLGTPLISPVAGFSERPAGSDPAVMAYVYDPEPPLAERFSE